MSSVSVLMGLLCLILSMVLPGSSFQSVRRIAGRGQALQDLLINDHTITPFGKYYRFLSLLSSPQKDDIIILSLKG